MDNPCFFEDTRLSKRGKNGQGDLPQRHLKQNSYSLNNNNIVGQYYQVSNDLKRSQRINSHEQPQLFIYPVTLPTNVDDCNSGHYSEKKPSGISIIYQPRCLVSRCGEDVKEVIRSAKLKKEWYRSGWRLQFVENKPTGTSVGQKACTLLCALLLATVITLLATGTVLHILRNAHPTTDEGTKRNTWFGVVMISGEFRVTNEVFRSSFMDQQSSDFQKLTSKLSFELDKLYSASILSEEYHSSVITHLMPGPGFGSKKELPGIIVQCQLALKLTDNLSPSKAGEAFLGGLRRSHSNVWLGNFSVDIQSIEFKSDVEKISWSKWSEWSECKRLPDGKFVRVRNRSCILQSGLHLSRADPCFLLDNTSNVDTIDCEETVNYTDSLQLSSTEIVKNIRGNRFNNKANTGKINSMDGSNDSSEINQIYQHDVTTEDAITNNYELSERSNFLEVTSIPTRKENKFVNIRKQPQINEHGQHVIYDFSKNDRRQCGLCVEGEVCVALKDDAVPYCLSIIDPKDPTGCGGHCKINVEICQRLQKDIYRCVDDTQCLENEWQCSNRLCIPLSKRCDGYLNCYDDTDEINCGCNLKTHFHCGKSLSCLPNEKRCDGVINCWDGADEFNCTKDCFGSNLFPCNNSQCIPTHQFCDGYPDCADHSDEPYGCGGDCKNNEFKCRNNRCIMKGNFCNGKDDCGDNSDEQSCANTR